MTPEQWRRIDEVFHQALDVADGDRSTWLDQTCSGETEVYREVAALLASDRHARAGGVGSRVKQALLAFHETSADRRRSACRNTRDPTGS